MKSQSDVDRVIEQLGNHAATSDQSLIGKIDAMVIVLGGRLGVAEINSRWSDRSDIRCACLHANAWLAGDREDSELYSTAGLELV